MHNVYQNYKVLVVDDNANMCQIYGAILRAFGLRDVLTALGAEEAWALLGTARPDLLILDLQMSDVNGLQLAQRIRSAPDSPDPFLAIIVVTAFSGRAQVLNAREVGVHEFVCKPFAPAGLLRRVVLALEEPRPFIRSASFFGPCRRRRDDGAPLETGERRRSCGPVEER